MFDHSSPINDRHLDSTTNMSCKREPACFAFLGANAVLAPMAIDRLNFDIASADFHQDRATVWATLDMHPDAADSATVSLLGFDENFLRPFTRAILEAGVTRISHRITIVPDPIREAAPRVVDYVRSLGGRFVAELIITPFEHVLSIGVPAQNGLPEETLFQIPRTDTFLKMFARMTHLADMALRDTLADMERLAKGRAQRM